MSHEGTASLGGGLRTVHLNGLSIHYVRGITDGVGDLLWSRFSGLSYRHSCLGYVEGIRFARLEALQTLQAAKEQSLTCEFGIVRLIDGAVVEGFLRGE